MSVSINTYHAAGNLTRDIVIRNAASGTAVGNTSLAINERTKRGGEWVEDVLFVDITMFGKTAENCAKHLVKGDTLYVEGKLQEDRWTGEDGVERKKIVCIVNKATFIRWGRDRVASGEGDGDKPPF